MVQSEPFDTPCFAFLIYTAHVGKVRWYPNLVDKAVTTLEGNDYRSSWNERFTCSFQSLIVSFCFLFETKSVSKYFVARLSLHLYYGGG